MSVLRLNNRVGTWTTLSVPTAAHRSVVYATSFVMTVTDKSQTEPPATMCSVATVMNAVMPTCVAHASDQYALTRVTWLSKVFIGMRLMPASPVNDVAGQLSSLCVCDAESCCFCLKAGS